MRIKVCFVYFIMSLNLYNDTFDVAVNHVFFFFILEAIFFSVSLTDRIFVLSFPLKKKNWDSFLSCWTLNFRVRLYFISQNVVIFFYFASFVLMLDVLFLSLGHYLIFKRDLKNENVFEIWFVKFILWMIFFLRILFLQKKFELWKRESCLNFVYVLYVFRQKGHVLGIQFVILNSDDVRTFTNMRSDVRSFLFGGRGYMYDVVL